MYCTYVSIGAWVIVVFCQKQFLNEEQQCSRVQKSLHLSRLVHQASESQNACLPYTHISYYFPKQLFLVTLRDNICKPLHQLEDSVLCLCLDSIILNVFSSLNYFMSLYNI